jgi:hypothetical protein
VPKVTITPEDFTFVGGFRAPDAVSFNTGLTHRYISGQLYLYSSMYAGDNRGQVYRFPVPNDSFLAQSGIYPKVGDAVNYGDIYQDKLVDLVDNGSGGGATPPLIGVSGGASIPSGLWWDEVDQRMYWAKTVNYNNTYSTSDACVGYSILGESSGTGVGSWKLSPPLYQGGFGNRWAFSFTPIPSSFATTYLGGRKIGVGFGGAVSIISNGPPSIGPALFAINSPSLGVDTHLDYMSSSPVELISHLDGVNRAKKAPELYTLSLSSGNSAGDEWTPSDTCKYGVWVEGANKNGVIFFSEVAGGNADSVVISSPEPTSSSFAVEDPGDIRLGDLIRIDTSVIRTESYPWQLSYVASVDGNVITLESPVTGIPTVGGRVVCGMWYDGGGWASSRWQHPWYIYSPDDFASVALGQKTSAEITPTYRMPVALAGLSSAQRGTGPGAAAANSIRGATFDSTTNRLMIASANEVSTLDIRIYQLNDDIIIPDPNPGSKNTRLRTGVSRLYSRTTKISI